MRKAVQALVALFRDATLQWLRDYAQSMGAALAFYTIFSIAPLLLIVIAIAGFYFGEEAARGEIYLQLQELGPILTLLLALTAVQFVIGNFLDPYVMGNSLNLSPFAILISLAVWSELWGIPGAFLAVPITAILTIVFSEFPGTRPVAVLLSQNGRV